LHRDSLVQGCSYHCKKGMRKPRVLLKGALYHVTARINRQEMVLDPSPMKDKFLDVLKRAKVKYKFTIDNFCIMGDHIHLLIRPGIEASLSRIMQWILSVFAMTYNRLYGLTGHVWGERFRSRIIAGLAAFIAVFGYIDMNPVKACLVSNPRDWRYGGLWHDRIGCREILDFPAGFVPLVFPEHGSSCLSERSFSRR